MHPAGRATLDARQEVDRSPDAESQPPRDTPCFSACASSSCCGAPTASRQKRKGLCCSMNRSVASTAAGSWIKSMGGSKWRRLCRPYSCASCRACCESPPISTMTSFAPTRAAAPPPDHSPDTPADAGRVSTTPCEPSADCRAARSPRERRRRGIRVVPIANHMVDVWRNHVVE